MKITTARLTRISKVILAYSFFGIISFFMNGCHTTHATQSSSTSSSINKSSMDDEKPVVDTSGGKDIRTGKDKPPRR